MTREGASSSAHHRHRSSLPGGFLGLKNLMNSSSGGVALKFVTNTLKNNNNNNEEEEATRRRGRRGQKRMGVNFIPTTTTGIKERRREKEGRGNRCDRS